MTEDDRARMDAHTDRIADLDDTLGRKTTRAAIATRGLILLVIVLGVTVAGLQLYTTLTIRETQRNNTTNLATTKDLAEQIRSCTTPGQPCYQRGQRQTAAAVGNIGRDNLRVTAAINACQSRGVTGYRPLIRCAVAIIAPPGKRASP